MDTARFLRKGFDIVPAENPDKLVELREKIFQKARQLVDYQNEDVEEFFNKFHRYESGGSSLNEKRVELVRYCSEQLDVGTALFEAFPSSIMQLVGPDILVQKTVGLVIQPPGDPDQVPIHRDSPPNSIFEVVVWLPLVDVYGTKSMFMLDRKQTDAALGLLKDPESGYEGYKRYAAHEGEILTLPFGNACFFWTGLVHGCPISTENETRWVLNVRYKNLFSPVGPKGLGEFFDLFRLSPLTRMALEYEKEVHG